MECQLTVGSCGKAGWMVKEPINFKVLSWWMVSEMRIKKAWMWPICFCFFSLHFLYFIPNSTILWGTQAVFYLSFALFTTENFVNSSLFFILQMRMFSDSIMIFCLYFICAVILFMTFNYLSLGVDCWFTLVVEQVFIA